MQEFSHSLGHEELLPPPRLTGRCGFRKRSLLPLISAMVFWVSRLVETTDDITDQIAAAKLRKIQCGAVQHRLQPGQHFGEPILGMPAERSAVSTVTAANRNELPGRRRLTTAQRYKTIFKAAVSSHSPIRYWSCWSRTTAPRAQSAARPRRACCGASRNAVRP